MLAAPTMAKIPISARRGVQGVTLLVAGMLIASAYFYATTGQGTPFPGCWPSLLPQHAWVLAAAQLALAGGLVFAALRDVSGPNLEDRLLITVVLATFSLFALNGGAYAVVTGGARLGPSGCAVVGPPWSYAIAGFSILVGAIALYAAAMINVGRHNSD